MRVTQNSVIYPYQKNLEDIQTRIYKEQIRLSTGNNIVSISDAPKEIANVKEVTVLIDQKNQYYDNIENALSEIYQINDQLESISDKLVQLQQYAIDATQTANSSNLTTLGVQVKGLLEDILKDANIEFDGKYIFAGTKTTSNSLSSTSDNVQPFVLVTDAASSDNPSGFNVVFNGNNKDRIINKDTHSQEIINTKAEEIFGAAGTEIFGSIIKLYNMLTYKSDGTKRTQSDALTTTETDLINVYQKNIAEAYDNVDIAAARNGSRLTRLTAIKDQMTEEITRLKEFRSRDKDTNVTQSTIQLSQDKSVLNYALTVGSNLFSRSLLDFLD